MNLFQILSCSDVGTCCGNYALVGVLDVGRRIVNLLQLLVPILLIAASIYQLIRMMINPDDKKPISNFCSRINMFIIAFSL